MKTIKRHNYEEIMKELDIIYKDIKEIYSEYSIRSEYKRRREKNNNK